MGVKEALKFAIELEKEGMKAYLDMALATGSPEGKNMFVWLAREELAHMKLFEEMLKEVEGEGVAETKGELEREEALMKEMMPKVKKLEVERGGKAEVHELDALRAALQLEVKTRDFYKEQAQKAEDPKVRDLFARLAEVEQGHYELIQAQIDYATQTGFWFGVREFNIEAG